MKIPLLADKGLEIARAYGVLKVGGKRKNTGRPFELFDFEVMRICTELELEVKQPRGTQYKYKYFVGKQGFSVLTFFIGVCVCLFRGKSVPIFVPTKIGRTVQAE